MFSFQPTTNRRGAPYDYDDTIADDDDGGGYGVVGDRRAALAAMQPRATGAIPWINRLPPAPPTVDGYFWRDAPIDDRQRAYCRCLLHVSARNGDDCYDAPGALGTGRCYNPYAVCTASVGRQSECSDYYAFTPQAVRGGIPDDEVAAYAHMRRLPVGPTREATVAAIQEYVRTRRK
nr:hypothetical protein [Pandoravirus belohorizontensis]